MRCFKFNWSRNFSSDKLYPGKVKIKLNGEKYMEKKWYLDFIYLPLNCNDENPGFSRIKLKS